MSLSRRSFIKVGLMGIGAASLTLNGFLVFTRKALAQVAWTSKYKFFTNEEGAIADAMVRRIVLADEPLRNAQTATVQAIDGNVHMNAGLQSTYINGLKDLDAIARKSGKGFAELGPKEQDAILKQIEGTPFFAAVRGDAAAIFYSQPDVWAHVKFPGPSQHMGGYIDKGFDKLSW